MHSLTLSKSAEAAVKRGHPWVFRDQTRPSSGPLKTGDATRILADGVCLGHALYDDVSPIAARLWTRGDEAISAELFRARVRTALARRARLRESGSTTALRLCNGEGDRMPGIVIDQYAHVAVIKTDSPAAELIVRKHVALLEALLREVGVTALVDRSGKHGQKSEPKALFGDLPTEEIVAKEHDVPFLVDVLHGQKTGAFLDQRENRGRVQALAKGTSRVLNLFSYAGGFSLRAALGGAAEVTSVDIAGAAHKTAQACFRAAGIEPKNHRFIASDAFAYLDQARARGERFDLIVCDPPSFAPSEKSVRTALSSYRRLHHACVSLLAPGGTFCASSCSSHVDAALFLTTLDDESLETARVSLVSAYGLPDDHPTLAAFPEGRYLKFAVLA